jgi:hypothetical protein
MELSDILGPLTKTYLFTHLARDGYKLWNRAIGEVDFDKETWLRRAGVVPYEPLKRTVGDVGFLLVGAAVGAVVALALAQKPGIEFRSDVRDRARGFLDQAKHRAKRVKEVERATA